MPFLVAPTLLKECQEEHDLKKSVTISSMQALLNLTINLAFIYKILEVDDEFES